MDEFDAIFALGAWLGAIRDRLRRGEEPVPGLSGAPADESSIEQVIEADARSFGCMYISAVSEWRNHQWPVIPLVDEYLLEIHAALRQSRWEHAVWEQVLTQCPTQLPRAIWTDFLDRDLHVTRLGHRWECEELLWRLADQVPEAVYNLAIRRYCNPEFSVDKLDELMYAFPDWRGVCNQLIFLTPDPPEKVTWLASRVREHCAKHMLVHRKHWSPAFEAAWVAMERG